MEHATAGILGTPAVTEAADENFVLHALLSRDSPLWLYVGYVDDEPVATTEVTLGGGVAGLFNISTIERCRRRGFGSAMTRRALVDAREAGYQVAVLQAAPDGVGLYTRVGFAPFGDITEYKPHA